MTLAILKMIYQIVSIVMVLCSELNRVHEVILVPLCDVGELRFFVDASESRVLIEYKTVTHYRNFYSGGTVFTAKLAFIFFMRIHGHGIIW